MDLELKELKRLINRLENLQNNTQGQDGVHYSVAELYNFKTSNFLSEGNKFVRVKTSLDMNNLLKKKNVKSVL